MLSLTPLSLRNRSERNTMLCGISVQSRTSMGCSSLSLSLSHFSALFSFPPLHLHRGECFGGVWGGRFTHLDEGLPSRYEELCKQIPETPLHPAPDRGRDFYGNTSAPFHAVPRHTQCTVKYAPPIFHYQVLCSPVHAWVNLEIKLYFHL